MNRFVNSLPLKIECLLAIAVATIPVSVCAQTHISQPSASQQSSKIVAPTNSNRSLAKPLETRIVSTNKSTPTIPPAAKPAVATKNLPPLEDVNLVLKLKEKKVYVYKGEQVLGVYPVGIGRKGRETPTGEWHVMETITNPGWTNFNTGKLVPPGPKNPLGTRWIGFWTDGQDTIGFHGTPQVNSIGKAVSNGCVRMYDKDVQAIYSLVKVGTIVRVVNE